MTPDPDKEFEKWLYKMRIVSSDSTYALLHAAYRAGDANATKRTAQRCVEICRGLPSAVGNHDMVIVEACARTIEKEFP